jgi:hypothetical protein
MKAWPPKRASANFIHPNQSAPYEAPSQRVAPRPHLQRSKALACLVNLRFNPVPQELTGGNMSPMRKTAGKKVAATRKRNAAKRQAAAKKAASTRKSRAGGKKAARTRTRPAAARKAAVTRARKKEAAPIQPVQVQEPSAPEPQVQATPETPIPE